VICKTQRQNTNTKMRKIHKFIKTLLCIIDRYHNKCVFEEIVFMNASRNAETWHVTLMIDNYNVFTHIWIISLVFISLYPMHNWSLCTLFLSCCTLWFFSLYYTTHYSSVCCDRLNEKERLLKGGGNCSMRVPCSIYAWYIIMYKAITIINYRYHKFAKRLRLINTKRYTQYNHTFMHLWVRNKCTFISMRICQYLRGCVCLYQCMHVHHTSPFTHTTLMGGGGEWIKRMAVYTCVHAHVYHACHAATHCNTLQYSTTHYNTMHHTATLCNTRYTLHYAATHCNALYHTAAHCSTLQHTATNCNTLQHAIKHYNTLQHTTTHCNTSLHTAIHCNTPPIWATPQCDRRQWTPPLPWATRAKYTAATSSCSPHRTPTSVRPLQRVAVRGSVLQCVAVWCSALRWNAVFCGV